MFLLLNSDIIKYISSFLQNYQVARLCIASKFLNDILNGEMEDRYQNIKKQLLLDWLAWCLLRDTRHPKKGSEDNSKEDYYYLSSFGDSKGEVKIIITMTEELDTNAKSQDLTPVIKRITSPDDLRVVFSEMKLDQAVFFIKTRDVCGRCCHYFASRIASYFFTKTPTCTTSHYCTPHIYFSYDKIIHILQRRYYGRIKHDFFFRHIAEGLLYMINLVKPDLIEGITEEHDFFALPWNRWSDLIDDIRLKYKKRRPKKHTKY